MERASNRTIAVFDFDETLTTKDILLQNNYTCGYYI